MRTAYIEIRCLATAQEAMARMRRVFSAVFDHPDVTITEVDANADDNEEPASLRARISIAYLSRWTELRGLLQAEEALGACEAFVYHPALKGKTLIWRASDA